MSRTLITHALMSHGIDGLIKRSISKEIECQSCVECFHCVLVSLDGEPSYVDTWICGRLRILKDSSTPVVNI